MASADNEDDDAQDPKTRLMHEVAEQMEAIEADFGDDFQIGHVVTIVEIVRPDGNLGVRVRSNQQPWIGLGLVKFAQRVLEKQAGMG